MLGNGGLLATELCTRGGVQSVMLQTAEVLTSAVQGGRMTAAACLSLNDEELALRSNPRLGGSIALFGAGKSKLSFVVKALTRFPRVHTLVAGHVALAPLAWLLKVLGRAHAFHVVLHGIEAWKPLPWLQRVALRRADSILPVTHYTARECALNNDLPMNAMRVLPPCCDERAVVPTPNFCLHGEFKLLCVARQDPMERYKGFEHMFEALALLPQELSGVHLNLVGAGGDQERLKAAARALAVADRVTFWGLLSEEDLAASYQNCDAFVMPSRNEGFGVVFLEAMRYAKPCIGGNHGGTPEVVAEGRNGFLVDYGDVRKLSDRIAALAMDPALCQRLGEGGLQTVRGEFSAASFMRRYMDVFAQGVRQ
jgi:phosphatidylinositol alpha-1,6-mannosyltransferase